MNSGNDPGRSWLIRDSSMEEDEFKEVYETYESVFSFRIHHSGRLTNAPGRMYVGGMIDVVELVDIDKFSVIDLDLMLDCLCYNSTEPMYYQFLHPEKNLDTGLEDFSCDQDCLNLAKHVAKHKVIDLYISHGLKNIRELFTPTKAKGISIEEIGEPGPYAIVPLKLNFQVGESSGLGQSSIDNGSSWKVNGDVFNGPNSTENDDMCIGSPKGKDDIQDNSVEEGTYDDIFFDGENKGMNDSDQSDSDYMVDPDNNMNDPDVDMTDYKMHIDTEVEDNINDQGHFHVDVEGEVLNNDTFDSGSESDGHDTSLRRQQLHKLRRANENKASFNLGQIFGTKQEAKKLIKKHAVETRRVIKIIKDDNSRVRAICQGSEPDFDVDDTGVHVASQPTAKEKKGQSKKKVKVKGLVRPKLELKECWRNKKAKLRLGVATKQKARGQVQRKKQK